MFKFKIVVKKAIKITRNTLWNRYTLYVEYAVTDTADSIFFLGKINLKERKTKLNADTTNTMNASTIKFIRSIIVTN